MFALKLQAMESVHADISLTVLKEARIIGMTTAGVAKHQKLITALGPKVSDAFLPQNPIVSESYVFV